MQTPADWPAVDPHLIARARDRVRTVLADEARTSHELALFCDPEGLLVAWGGINGPVQREVRTNRLTLRVWDADEIVNRLLTAYGRLPDNMRARIPLKQAWVLDEESG